MLGIWKIIKGWLDPVVAAKVNFTNNPKELQEFMDLSKVPKELDGEEDWEYKYVEPVPGENDKLKDTATRDKLLATREELVKEYEESTAEWIHNPEAFGVNEKRNAAAAKLRKSYFDLDPYVRARSYYDRIGMIGQGGQVDFYPTAKPTETASAPVAHTSADDVD